MPTYETVFIVRQSSTQQQTEAITKRVTKMITNVDGSILRSEQWGLRNLAFRVQKNRKGFYVLINHDTPSEIVPQLADMFRLDEDVIRFVTFGVDAVSTEPSVIMARRGERGDRDDRRTRYPRDGDSNESELERGHRHNHSPDDGPGNFSNTSSRDSSEVMENA